jgi:integrase
MLTDTAIKQVRPSNKTQKLFDGYRTGLHLLVHPGGRKTFAIKYPHPITKKERTFTIGPYPHITLKEAREETEKARTLLVHGIDPQEDKVKRKAEIKAAYTDTFEQLANDWITFRGARWSESYRHKVRTTLARHLLPALGKTPITKITAKFLLSLLRPIENSGKTDLAHTLLEHASAIFKFAMIEGRASDDPASALRGALIPHRQVNLVAVTTPEDFRELLMAMDSYKGEYVTRAALEFTMLTFQRTQSILLAQWSQIDWNARLWRIPAETMKMKEPHLVPLSRQAIELLRALQPLTGHSDFIFKSISYRSKPISGNTMLYALGRLGFRGRMTVHGFRTTASTLLNENNFRADVVEAALAHTKGDIRSIYNRARYLQERTEMYQWWADYVDQLRNLPQTAKNPNESAP